MLKFDYNNRGTGPFRLRRVDSRTYQIHKFNGPAFEGPAAQIFRKAIELGVDPQELEIAVGELDRHGHDYAEFGIFGRFIYTMSKDKKAA